MPTKERQEKERKKALPRRLYAKCNCGNIAYIGRAFKDFAGICSACGALITCKRNDLMDSKGNYLIKTHK